MNLQHLRILDMSYNLITKIASYELPSIEYTSLVSINFSHNSLESLPNILHSRKHLTHADFSHNRINFSTIWPHNMGINPSDIIQPSVYLLGNNITHLDLSKLEQSQINDLHNVLENFDLHLDGN